MSTKLPTTVSSALRKSLRESTANLRFVRVGAQPEFGLSSANFSFYYHPEPNCPTKIISSMVSGEVSEEESRKHVERICNDFRVKSGVKIVRKKFEEDRCPEFFYSKNMVEPVLNQGRFEYVGCEKHEMVVVPFYSSQEPDLICYLDDKDMYTDTKWWVCSDQFMRMWTLIHFDTHRSFYRQKTKTPTNTALGNKKYFMSGNRLVTDSWKKYILSCFQNNVEVDYEKSIERFYTKRTELCGQDHIDLYAALVSLAVFADDLSRSNVPTVGEGAPEKADSAREYQRKYWHIPVETIVECLEASGLVMTQEERKQRISEYTGYILEEENGKLHKRVFWPNNVIASHVVKNEEEARKENVI